MYTDPGFYDLVPGTIGTVQYAIDVTKKMSDEEKQSYVSKSSNERMRAYLMNMTYGMQGNNPLTPEEAYIKARQDSWGDLEGFVGRQIKTINVQVAQKETYDVLLKIEQSEDFIEWLNPLLIQSLKEVYLNQKTI